MNKLLEVCQKLHRSREFKRHRPMLTEICQAIHIIIHNMKMGDEK
jgi:hypothetical protein